MILRGLSLSIKLEIIKFDNNELSSIKYWKYGQAYSCPGDRRVYWGLPQGVRNPCMPTVPTFAVRETDVSRHNGGTSGAPLKPLRDDSALRGRGFKHPVREAGASQHRGAKLRAPLKQLELHGNIVPRVLRMALNGPQLLKKIAKLSIWPEKKSRLALHFLVR